MNENRHRTLSLMNDIHPEYVVNVAFGGAKDGIDGKIGRDGEPGKDGAPGEDGFSPIVEAFRNQEDTGIIVRVTDKDGTRETYVQDGTSSTSDRSEMFNQRLDDVLRFQNYVSGEFDYTTDTSIRATDIEMSTDGDKPGKISLEAAETRNGQTRIQSGKIWLGDYNSSGDYEKLITLDAINNNWRTYQTIIENGELSLKDLDNGYRTVVISGTSNKPYIDMRSDSNTSTHSIKLQVNGDKGSTNILNGQIVLKDESGNKQIDVSSRTNGKGIVKLSDKKIIESNGSVFKLYNNNGDNIFNISNDGIDYPAGDAVFIDKPYISTNIPTLPDHPEVSVDDGDYYPTGSININTFSNSGLLYYDRNNGTFTYGGVQYLKSNEWMALQNNGNDVVYSYRDRIAWYDDGGYSTQDKSCSTTLSNSGYNDIVSASVNIPLPTQSGPETGYVNYCNCMGSGTMLIESRQDDNGDPYDIVDILVQGDTVAVVNGQSLNVDDRLSFNEHKLSDIVTYNQAFMNGGNLVLRNNTIFTADVEISNKSFSYTGGDCIIEFTTPASGSITISFPITITFDEYPTFGNEEHWIIGIRDGWAVWTMYDISQ